MPFTRRPHVTARKHVPSHEVKDLPEGVKLLAWARTVRWVGWGFGESLIPIFLFTFATSYAEAGLFSSILEIAALMALPIIGMLADRIPAKFLVIAGLLVYPFVGISYFLAGMTGMALFIVIARVANGISWSLDTTGTDTYYRRVTSRLHLASSFGYIEALAHLGWIAAGLVSIALVPYVPAYVLLLFIAPFAFVALPFVLRAPKDPVKKEKRPRFTTLASYRNTFAELGSWNTRMHLIAALVLFMGIIDTLIWLFIPIDAYIEGANLIMVILLGLVGSVPTLAAYAIGKFADRHNKYLLIALALLGIACLMAGLAAFPSYGFKLVASFLIGILMVFLGIAGKFLVTVLGPEATYGSRGSAFEGIATIGNIAAPLIIGISLDALGFSSVALLIAFAAAVFAAIFSLVLRHHPQAA